MPFPQTAWVFTREGDARTAINRFMQTPRLLTKNDGLADVDSQTIHIPPETDILGHLVTTLGTDPLLIVFNKKDLRLDDIHAYGYVRVDGKKRSATFVRSVNKEAYFFSATPARHRHFILHDTPFTPPKAFTSPRKSATLPGKATVRATRSDWQQSTDPFNNGSSDTRWDAINWDTTYMVHIGRCRHAAGILTEHISTDMNWVHASGMENNQYVAALCRLIGGDGVEAIKTDLKSYRPDFLDGLLFHAVFTPDYLVSDTEFVDLARDKQDFVESGNYEGLVTHLDEVLELARGQYFDKMNITHPYVHVLSVIPCGQSADSREM